MNFPPHKCGLYLTHNEHRDHYKTVAEWEEPMGTKITFTDVLPSPPVAWLWVEQKKDGAIWLVYTG